jgi:trehalose utilization protein
MADKISVVIWNEFVHEKSNESVKKIYPDGMHMAIKRGLQAYDKTRKQFKLSTATMDQPEHGLTQKILDKTDVLIWWAHMAHDRISDEVVSRVQRRVLEGMGLIVLHSGHYSKIFQRLMGTDCGLKWREVAEKERIWVIERAHPIAEGLGEYFELPNVEMYGEAFLIPKPDELVFISWFEGGEVFRSGCTWNRGNGKVFYFRPGHETYPIYHNENVIKVIGNAIRWARPTVRIAPGCPHYPNAAETIRSKMKE